MFFDIDPRFIGRIGDGKHRATGVIDVATFQSLVRGGTVADLEAGYGHVVVDECDHGAASSFEQVLSAVQARSVTGLAATPKRRDGQHPIFEMQLGPARYVVDRRSSSAITLFARRLVVRETEFELTGETDPSIQHIYRSLADEPRRNDLILNDVIGALDAGRSPLVLTERKDHLDFLAGRLRAFTRHLIVLQGGVGAKKRRDALAALCKAPRVPLSPWRHRQGAPAVQMPLGRRTASDASTLVRNCRVAAGRSMLTARTSRQASRGPWRARG